MEPARVYLVLCALVGWCRSALGSHLDLKLILLLLLLKYLRSVFLKLRRVRLGVVHGAVAAVGMLLGGTSWLCLGLGDLQIPAVSVASDCLEQGLVEQ